jgi:hypothetical protein
VRQVPLPQMSKPVEVRIPASVLCARSALAAPPGDVRPHLRHGEPAALCRPAAECGLHVPHRCRFKACGQGGALVIVAPNRLVHPAPVKQQRVSRSGSSYRARIRAEARGTQQGTVLSWRQEGQQVNVSRGIAQVQADPHLGG